MTRACALARGLDFLAARQDRDGAWRDFDLPGVGAADAWTTAYVARCLRDAMRALHLHADDRIEAAAGFLQRSRDRRGGWSYNAACPPDADSTAQALLLLGPTHPRDASALARFQCPDGGFRTYLWPKHDHPWGRSQPDVTATALRALLLWLTPQHRIMQRGLEWLRRSAAAAGVRSYWWTSAAYSELEFLRLRAVMPDAPAVCSARSSTSTPFEAALALECAILSGASRQDIDATRDALLTLQCPDGDWPTGRILRLPDFPDGECRAFEDTRRLFTTASVVSALALYGTDGDRRMRLTVDGSGALSAGDICPADRAGFPPPRPCGDRLIPRAKARRRSIEAG